MVSFIVGFVLGAAAAWIVTKYGWAGLWERLVGARDWLKSKLPGQ